MQDEIVARLASQLGAQLIAAEARRAEHAPNPDSMDLYLQGVAYLNKGWTAEHIASASVLFERALERDRGNMEALLGAAFADYVRCIAFLVDDPAPLLAAAEAKVTKVLSQVPDHAFAHFCLGRIQINTNRSAQGVAECERALALDRNLAGAHAMIGIAKYRLGHPDESEAHIKEALRLSPRDTIAHVWLAVAGFAKVMLGREQEAVAWLRRAIEANRNYALAYFWLAAALAHLGRLDEARVEVQTGLALDPQFTLRRYRAGPGSDNPTFLAQPERTCDGMGKAGVPEA